MEFKQLSVLVGFIGIGAFCHAQNLRVMTYNIRLDIASDGQNAWPLRQETLSSQIRFYEPDIFGIQEARPNQVIDLSNALPQYDQVGMGREGPGKGESSNIYYKKDRFRILESNTFWLSETPGKISLGWDAAYNRVCSYVLLRDKKARKKLWVFNTHLDHVGEEARSKGIQLILSKIASLNTKNFPVILMGDFNSEPASERISMLKKVMNDSRELSEEKPFGPEGTFNGFNHQEPVTRRIDYIFISKNDKLKVKKHAILTDSKDLKYPSDHFPVFVQLNYN